MSAMHDPRAALDAAIRDYLQWAGDRPGSQHVTSRLQELQTDIQNLPSPVSQGPGVIPTQKPGGSFERGALPSKEALAMMMGGGSDG